MIPLRGPFRFWLLLSAVAVLFLTFFWPVLQGLITQWWEDDNYSHCFFVPLVSAYFLWEKRSATAASGSGSTAGFVALVLSLGLFFLFRLGGIQVGQRLALILALNAAVLYNLGFPAYRRLLFPLLFLFLMIPLPLTIQGALTFPLQLFATTCARGLLDMIHIPVIQAGNILHLPTGSLQVVDACSGIRSLFAFLAFGFIVAHLKKGRPGAQAVLILSAVPLAFGANILRIVASGALGAIYGIEIARGFLHNFSGIALSVLGIAAYFGEARLLDRLRGGVVSEGGPA